MTKLVKGFIAVMGSALLGLTIAGIARAATENVVAEVEFVNPVAITENNALQFGKIDVAFTNSESITVGTDDSVTDANGRVAGGTQAAAELSVTADASQTITIEVDNVVSGTGYTLATFMCSYDGGSDTACDGGGYTATSVANALLEIGATISGDGNAVLGTSNGSFDVTVLYQ